MVFSTIIFLLRFLPITLALYYLAPPKLKNTVLFLCSLVFYCWGEVRFFPVMLALILINYLCGLGLERFEQNKTARLILLLIALAGSLGMLFYFKYANFVLSSINAIFGTGFAPIQGISVLPLGISFYTFQTLSYTIDVYRRDVKTEHNIIDFGAYVVMFPQLIAGPIVKYRDVSDRLHVYKGRYELKQIEDGMTLFTFGLAKKVLLADAIGALWTDIIGVADSPSISFVGLANASTPLVWLGVIAYSLQLYFDFSGYSLMGIGMGRMLGFDFPQNFNYPYISGSITEFWRRWHMTLSGWFREYVYIPLGGNRKGLKRQIFNLFVVELLTGIWHGANWNFICWGLYYFVLLALEKLFLLPYLKKGQGLAPYLHPLPRGRGLGHVRGQRRRRGVRPAVPQAFHPFRRRDAPLLPAQLRRTAGGLRRLLHPAHRKAVEAAFPQCHHQGADHSGAADGLDGLRRGQHQQPVPVFQLLRGGVNDGQTFKALRFDFPLSGPYRIHPVFCRAVRAGPCHAGPSLQ